MSPISSTGIFTINTSATFDIAMLQDVLIPKFRRLQAKKQKDEQSALEYTIYEIHSGKEFTLEEPIDFTWTVNNIEESIIEFKIDFADPLEISNSLMYDHHALYIKVLQENLFAPDETSRVFKSEISEPLVL